MNDDSILILIAGMVVAFLGGFMFGRMSMLSSIIQAVVEEAEKEVEQKRADNILTVEKHNDMYYAYVDGNFAAQGSNFDDLFTAVKSNKNYDVVNINRATAATLNLSREEAKVMAEAIGRVYGKKECEKE